MGLSFWLENKEKFNLNKLQDDINVDVCIVGGGITGVLCAYMLKESGLKVVLVEKNKLAEGVTGYTTAKLTSGHSIMYDKMKKDFGIDKAKLYFEANEWAINEAGRIVEKENIDCDFKKEDSYVLAQSVENMQVIKDEFETLNKIGANVELVNNTELPINIALGICYKNQAQFHVIKYLNALINSIKDKIDIYEDTKVIDIDKKSNGYEVITKEHVISAKHVILATHYPIKNIPGYYFMKMYQERSYVVAVKTKKSVFEGMYITIDSPIRSFRNVDTEDGKIVLIGGEEHKSGEDKLRGSAYKNLENYAKTIYPDCEILYKWSAQDCMGLDNVPYIGEYSKLTPNMYVATGYKKWGMTTSHIAASIITDKVLGKKNRFADAFTATRFEIAKFTKEIASFTKESVKGLLINKFKIPKEKLKDINDNEGRLIEIEGQKIGVYKDENGKLFGIKPICTHLRL